MTAETACTATRQSKPFFAESFFFAYLKLSTFFFLQKRLWHKAFRYCGTLKLFHCDGDGLAIDIYDEFSAAFYIFLAFAGEIPNSFLYIL